MSLHEAIGAMVGGGIGATRLGVERDVAAQALGVIADVLAEAPSNLSECLSERVEPEEIREPATLGATVGVSGLPLWDRLESSRRGPYTDRELVQMAVTASLGKDSADTSGWPLAEKLLPHYIQRWHPSGFHTPLPQDEGVVFGDVVALGSIETDAVVSLCRMGSRDVPPGVDHVEVWLVDENDPAVNPNLAFVLLDVATTIGRLRDEGKLVFVHCVRAESRTPIVAASYLALRHGLSGSQALAITDSLIPGPGPKATFRKTLSQQFD